MTTQARALVRLQAAQLSVGLEPTGTPGPEFFEAVEALKRTAHPNTVTDRLKDPADDDAENAAAGLNRTLELEYESLWRTMEVRPGWQAAIDRIVDRIKENRARYEAVSDKTGVPWQLIGALHNLEASGSFSRHLHNGDPLSRKTVNVPAGRPPNWDGSGTWEESAIDALTFDKLAGKPAWTLALTLYRAENFNGTGYRKYHPDVLTPYLWSGTNHYKKGKYIADGKWSQSAVSEQVGVAPILKALALA